MNKLRVHDLAGEFGITSDEVINLLRQMDVPVRSHLSPLSDDQIARIRARWEREKRARVAAPPAAARRRRGTAAAAPPPEPKPEPVAADAVARRRRRVAPDPVSEVVAEAPEAAVIEAPPAPEAAPPAPVAATTAPDSTIDRPPVAPVPAPRRAGSPAQTSQPSHHGTDRGDARDRQRPQPVVPGAPRPRPVATGAPYSPPRPVASAAPGAGTAPPRRDERPSGGRGDDRGARRGKKGKRGVDQEAVSANIGKTMATMRGPIRRGGARRAEDGT